MDERRCKKCHKLLMKLSYSRDKVVARDVKVVIIGPYMEIKCPKCKTVNRFDEEKLVSK